MALVKKDTSKEAAQAQEKSVFVSFVSSVSGALVQGIVGAVVGASISAVTDPVVNRVLVKRMSIGAAFRDLTTKLNAPPSVRGMVSGTVFTTATLPLTNFRYARSVGEPVTGVPFLFKAFIPTVLRDVTYSIVRSKANEAVQKRWPQTGQFPKTFACVMGACVASAPWNEVRGFCLQPVGKRLPVAEFFQPMRFVRSTALGATVMALSLGAGAVLTRPLEQRARTLWAARRARRQPAV